MTKGTRSKLQAPSGLSFKNRVSGHHQEEPTKVAQASGEVFWKRFTGRRPKGKPRTKIKTEIFHLKIKSVNMLNFNSQSLFKKSSFVMYRSAGSVGPQSSI